ncbi:MAG: RNA polymerase sigma factor SigJ [Planctomycetota bacterium]|nr:RNA polymerase sigma factor SigJ [Planctomycetota bacterium]
MSRALEEFEDNRSRLFALSYRMLGTLNDVEDVLQEAWLKWSRVDHSSILNAPGFLTTVVTRLCIDQLRKGKSRREEYIGPWLPEPLVTSETEFKAGMLAETLTTAFLVLLERLSPKERAVFLLREVFEIKYEEIGEIVQATEGHCRQMLRRGKERIQSPRQRFSANPEQSAKIMESFLQTCAIGDVDGLKRLLAEDVVTWSDSDGKALAARKPVYGVEKVTRFILGLFRKIPAGFRMEPRIINGSPGIISWQGEALHSALWLDIDESEIRNMYITVNPEKLGGIVAQSNF